MTTCSIGFPPPDVAPSNAPRRGAMLDTSAAADFLGISPRTLEDWRLRGGGPVFRKLGGRLVRYLSADLFSFIEAGARTNTGGMVPA